MTGSAWRSVCGANVESAVTCSRVTVKDAGTRCEAATRVEVACELDTAPGVPVSNRERDHHPGDAGRHAATTPIRPSRWPRRIWTVAGMDAETLIVVLPSE